MSEMKKDLELFNELVHVLLAEEKEKPVAARIDADSLFETLDLRLGEHPSIDEELKNVLTDLIVATPKSATRLFFNQLFGGRQSKAVLGDLMAVLFNNSMYTYKVAGPHVGIEQEVITRCCQMVGFGEKSNGTFATGGSMCNYMALIMGRDAKNPNVRQDGVNQSMTMYTSADSHYSNAKNASFAGMGRNNVRYIPTDEFGRMIPALLEEQILKDLSENRIPTFINATAGTTILGAFDDVETIAEIAKKYNVWLHVDGAYAGGSFFSKQYKHLLNGVEKADSFSFNAHKMMGTPLTCSIILVKDKKNLFTSFSNDADYLYQTDGDDFNLGKTSFQCGRRNDALKFWTLWKSIGTSGLSRLVEKQYYLADVARAYIRSNPDYELYSFDNSLSVCFNYKNIDADILCTALYENQITMVGFGAVKGKDTVRMITINANNEKEDILNFFAVIEEFVKQHPELYLLNESVESL